VTSVAPGDEAGLDEVIRQLREALASDAAEMALIRRMSDVSFREWLRSASERIAAALGISLGTITAYFADLYTIALNARSSYVSSYRGARDRGRRIRRER
jgi:hypothetical protein